MVSNLSSQSFASSELMRYPGGWEYRFIKRHTCGIQYIMFEYIQVVNLFLHHGDQGTGGGKHRAPSVMQRTSNL